MWISDDSCRDAKTKTEAVKDGIFTIRIGDEARDVLCDMTTDGGGWTVRCVDYMLFHIPWHFFLSSFHFIGFLFCFVSFNDVFFSFRFFSQFLLFVFFFVSFISFRFLYFWFFVSSFYILHVPTFMPIQAWLTYFRLWHLEKQKPNKGNVFLPHDFSLIFTINKTFVTM